MSNDKIKPARNRKGLFSIILGLLLLAAALLLVVYNYYDAYLAELDSEFYKQYLLEDMESYVPDEDLMWDTYLDSQDPNRKMPTIVIGKEEFIGVLEVPLYNLALPVMSDCDYRKLKHAPCVYSGTYYRNDLVICAHNYRKHFSNLKWIPTGSEVRLIAVDGATYTYEVTEIETLKDTAVKEMTIPENREWDMTLFTCTTGGQARAAVRCVMKEKTPPKYMSDEWYEMPETGKRKT